MPKFLVLGIAGGGNEVVKCEGGGWSLCRFTDLLWKGCISASVRNFINYIKY